MFKYFWKYFFFLLAISLVPLVGVLCINTMISSPLSLPAVCYYSFNQPTMKGFPKLKLSSVTMFNLYESFDGSYI